MAESEEELKSLLMKVKESETVGLNLNIQKDDGIWSHHFKASETCSVVSNSFWPHGLCSPWNSLGQNTGGGSLSLLQGIFPTQGLNPSHLHCRLILYQLRHKLSPFMANRWGRGGGGNDDRLYFLGPKITADGDCGHEIKRCLLLARKAMTN